MQAFIIVELVIYVLLVFFWSYIRENWIILFVSRPLVYSPLWIFYKIIYSFGKEGSGWSLTAFVVSFIIYIVIVWLISKNLDKIRRMYRRARGKKEAEELEGETENAKRVIKAINKGAKERGGFEIG